MDADIEIRTAVAGDAESIAEVLFQAFFVFKNEYTPGAFAAVTPTTDEIMLRFGEGPMWIVTKRDAAIGTVSVITQPEGLYIRSMAVSPSAHGLGIGRMLLEAVEKYAIEKGFERLFLYTTSFLFGAIHLYEKSGFVHVRDTTADEWHGVPGLEMEKKLVIGIKQNVVGS